MCLPSLVSGAMGLRLHSIKNSNLATTAMAHRDPTFILDREAMKYLLLVHHDETAFNNLSEDTQRQMLEESVQLTHKLHADKQYLSASPLHPAATAAIVRMRDGKRLVTDGPFMETKEQLAGYFLIEATDNNEAIAIAARIPGARIGTVEVRPVTEITGLPIHSGPPQV